MELCFGLSNRLGPNKRFHDFIFLLKENLQTLNLLIIAMIHHLLAVFGQTFCADYFGLKTTARVAPASR